MHSPAPSNPVGPLPLVKAERRPWRRLAALAAALVAMTLAAPASALEINLDYDEDSTPSWDPTGERLMMIARAAADIWESHIMDFQSIHFDISWDNLDGEDRLAKYLPSYVPYDSIDLVFSTEKDNAPVNWFMDETPLLNEEYGPIQAVTARELTPEHIDEAFAGPVPALMEVGAFAVAKFGTPANGNIDLLTIMMHEMGHALGMNYSLTDDDYDFHPQTIGGLEVGAMEDDGYELVLQSALMNDNASASGIRTFPSATDILATHDQNGYSRFRLDRIDLLGAHSDSWTDTINWIGGQVPTGRSDVFVRNGGSVRLNSSTAETKSLLVDEGSSMVTAFSSSLRVLNQLRVGNAANGTQGTVKIGNLVGAPKLEAASLLVDNGVLDLASQEASMLVHHKAQISAGSTLMGAGTVEVRGELNNDGEISAGTFMLFGFSGDLVLRAAGAQGKLDLDGGMEPVNGIGAPIPGLGMEFGRISAVNGNLQVASPLADDFNGVATVGADRTLSFNYPWAMGGELNLRGGNDGMSIAMLTGAEMIWGGSTIVEGVAMITAPVTTGSFTRVHVRSGGFLNLIPTRMGLVGGPTEFRGRLSLEPNAMLHVNVDGVNSWTLTKSLELGAGAIVNGDDLVNRGRIMGDGKLAAARVDNLGTMAPGNYTDATGVLDVTSGLFNQGAAARLEMDIAGFSQGSFDVLRAGVAQIGGTLAIALADGFLPAVGSQFDLVTATNLAGAFSNLTLSVPNGVTFSGVVDYQSTKATFRVTQAALDADIDVDGDVDANDLKMWQSTGSAQTNGGFLLLWQRQLGRHLNTPGSLGGGFGEETGGGVIGGVVPEPATALLGLAALAVLPRPRKR